MANTMEQPLLLDNAVPETLELSSSSPNAGDSEAGEMMVEESPINEETVEHTVQNSDMEEESLSLFSSPVQPEMGAAYESDSFGTAAVNLDNSHLSQSRDRAEETEIDNQGLDGAEEVREEEEEEEEERILDLTEDDEDIVDDTDHEEEREKTRVSPEEEEKEDGFDVAEDTQQADPMSLHQEDQTAGEKEGVAEIETVELEETQSQAVEAEDQPEESMVEEQDSQRVEEQSDVAMQLEAEQSVESLSVVDAFPSTSSHPGKKSEPADKPAKAYRGPAQKSKAAVRRKTPKEKNPKAKPKATKTGSSEVSVPTVTVTAPSDQSDDEEAGKDPSSSTSVEAFLANYPKRIENSDNLPPGWRRVCVLRMTGKTIGRYDTTMFSDTKEKMRSFPNVVSFLEKSGQMHLLENPSYDFKFNQPFSPRWDAIRQKQGSLPLKTPKHKTPPTAKSVKTSKSKTPPSSAKKAVGGTPITSKVSLTLKRKVPIEGSDSQSGGDCSPEFSSIWEVKDPPKAKARKKAAPASKKDSPQLKLDAFIAKFKPSPGDKESKLKSGFKTVLHKPSPADKDSKPKSGFKTVLHGTSRPKKLEEESASASDDAESCASVAPEPCDMMSDEKSIEVRDSAEEETKEADQETKEAEEELADKDSKPKCSFKTVLHETSRPKKSEEESASASDDAESCASVAPEPCDLMSDEKSIEVRDSAEEETKEADQETKEAEEETKEAEQETIELSSDDASTKECDAASDVYLAEEQEAPYKTDNDDDNNDSADDRRSEDIAMETEAPAEEESNKDAEECLSEGASVFELKSEESNNSSTPTPTPDPLPAESSSDAKIGDFDKPAASTSAAATTTTTTVSRSASSKRSLSPSDSDASTHKRARLWRGDVGDTEEESSSRSVGMCSDTSLTAGQDEDENQNMTVTASKVMRMHLSDSSSSRDMKDSASTSSSNCSSLPPSITPTFSSITPQLPSTSSTSSLLSPSWKKSHRGVKKGSRSRSSSSLAGSPGRPREARRSLQSAGVVSDDSQLNAQAIRTNGAAAGGPVVQTKGGLHREVSWSPPRSPFNLIQERLCHDPWKMLLATVFMQQVEVERAIPLLWKFLNRWFNAEEARAAETEHVARILSSMDRNQACAASVVKFSEEYLTKDWEYPIELHGIDKYGNDSYRIFCVPEWSQVDPDDERLKNYCLWLKQNHRELGVQ